jgi:hypothetical protein
MVRDNFAVVCAGGIGDALLMQIAAAHLRKMGRKVVLFSNHLDALRAWFPESQFAKQPLPEELEDFDAIVLQHDNTEKARGICSLSRPVYVFYGAHSVQKHGPLRAGLDVVFDRSRPMAKNIADACATLFPEVPATLCNGLTPPPHLTARKFSRRIAIHPVSTSLDKNWHRRSFIRLYERLVSVGLEPVFITPPEGSAEWGAPVFQTLACLTSFLYESGSFIGNDSGPGHLASNLGLKTLTIGSSASHLSFWRPGWSPGAIVHPPKWVSSTKLLRNKWADFITVDQVFKSFMKLNELN